MGDRFPDVDWWCDRCGAHLNFQKGFDDHKYIWKCTECGFKNSISREIYMIVMLIFVKKIKNHDFI